MCKWLLFFILINCTAAYGQQLTGTVVNAGTKLPIAYVNIGIPGKNIGTVSDDKGNYTLEIASKFDLDTLQFSSVGYKPLNIKVADFKKRSNRNLSLTEKAYVSDEVVVKPRNYKLRLLGVTSQSQNFRAGFRDNNLGYECGILMKVKKSAYIRKVYVNIAHCTYDSIFYRLNIYSAEKEQNFQNILQSPIYIKLPKDELKGKITIDIEALNLVTEGDFLVTLEHVKDLGPGYLFFSAGLSKKTYYRKTSQGEWLTSPVGISISVEADVER